MKTKIYGASDDLIIIEGDIDDEVEAYKAKRCWCSDGTEFTIKYDAEWVISIIEEGTLFDKIIPSVGDNNHSGEFSCCSGYSDILILNEGIEWIKIGNKTFKV